jgi:fibronectin-binding autotransporter adhesin
MVSKLRLAAASLALLAAARLSAQTTVTWSGGFPNYLYSSASNWGSGATPLGDGTENLQFTDASSGDLQLDTNAAFLGVQVNTGSQADNFKIKNSGGTLSIGAGGITVQGTGEVQSGLTISANVALGANQTWAVTDNLGMLGVYGVISGNYGLTLQGNGEVVDFSLGNSSNSFTGGVHLEQSGSVLYAATGALGSGALLLDDNTTLAPWGNTATFSNAVTIGSQGGTAAVYFGGNNGGESSLTLTGAVTLNDSDLEISVLPNSLLTLSGNLNGYTSGVCLDFGSAFPSGLTGPAGQNGIAIVGGNITNVNRLDLEDNVSVILAASSPSSGTSQISTLGDIGVTTGQAYLGLASTYNPAGYVTGFLGWLNSSGSAGNFHGTLGFDTLSGTMATFSDPIDLTNFTAAPFAGLGSATSAILGTAAVITPPGGATGTTYPFGGGGGTLVVQSDLPDGSVPRNLVLSAGGAPLTLVLSGNLTYTGGTSVTGGALIFNTPPPTSGTLTLGSSGWTSAGYIGSLTTSGYSDGNSNIQSFVDLAGHLGTGVVGFDGNGTQRTVTSPVSLADEGLGNNVFLGSATSVLYSGTITPNTAGSYQFSGVKGGTVEVSSSLTGASDSVTVGLPVPMESFNPATGSNSVSTVILSGNNTYAGPTTLNSGNLDVTNSNSIGTGTLIEPSPQVNSPTGWQATLEATVGPVTLANNIEVSNGGLSLNPGSSNLLTLTGLISDYVENNGTLGIFGPVNLSGANTYSGGTVIQGATVNVGSDTGLGTGSVTIQGGSTVNFNSLNPVLATLGSSMTQIYQSTVSFSGSPIINSLQMAQSTINFNGALATINGMSGDGPGSTNIINLATGTALVIDTEETLNGNNGSTFNGTINGGSTSTLDVIGGGSMELRGSNTYGGGMTVGPTTVVIVGSNGALGTGPVTVEANGALALNNGINVSNPITLQSGSPGAGLAGFGTFSTTAGITFSGGSGVDPGRGNISGSGSGTLIPIPGTLTFGSSTPVTFGPGGLYLFSITDATGAAGSGYGTIRAQGGLNITASAGTPFDIYLFSYDPTTGQTGNALNFSAAGTYSWTLATASSITNFNPAYFSVLTTNFSNPTGIGTFYVSESGNDLMLNFTPVPEPSTWALVAAGAAAIGIGAAWRRRRA